METDRVNILLVDDLPENLLALEAILNDLGHNLVKAESGRAALRAALEHDFAVVLLDVQMPDMDGFETAALIRQRDRSAHTPIVFLTAVSRSEAEVFQGYVVGAVDYVFKPVVPDILRAKVNVFIDLYRMRHQLEAINIQLRQEIAERKQTKTERDRFFTLSLDMLCIAGFDGYFKQLNPAWEKTLGFTAAELIAQPYLAFVHPDDRAATIAEAQKLTTGVATVYFENRYRCQDGAYKWLAWTSAPFVAEQLLYAVARDITPQKESEEALRKARDELELRVAERTGELQAKNDEITAMSQQLMQAAKLATMGELAASIAHELNNPLATVSLRVEGLLAAAPDGSPPRRSLQVVEQEVERMATLVANLLQFSRRSQPQISTVDVREEIRNSLGLIHYRLRKHRVTLVEDFAAEAPSVLADRQQLRQLFLNLYNNAVDAMQKTGGTLTTRVAVQGQATKDAAPGQRRLPLVVIEISDTGMGISPANLHQAAEPFFTTKPEGQGTGLGLPICLRIAQEHGGTLEILSEGVPGKGTTVRVTLPVAGKTNGNYLRESLGESET